MVEVSDDEGDEESEAESNEQADENPAPHQVENQEPSPSSIIPINSQSKVISKRDHKLKINHFSKKSKEEWEQMHDLIQLIRGKKCEVRRLENELKEKWGNALEIPEPETPPMPDNPSKDDE